MGLVAGLRRLIGGSEPTVVDFERFENGPGANSSAGNGPGGSSAGRVSSDAGTGVGTYKIQQSYDSLVDTVRQLREALDGQTRRQEELLSKLATLPQAVEALPQTSKMQNDMLKMINERLGMHAEQQRKVSEVVNSLGDSKKEQGEALQAIKEQIETGNEIDRQLVDSFNRFSMMIDRLHIANNHAVEALQQVRDSYAHSQLQMQEWIEKSRHRNTWLIGGAFAMAAIALVAVVVLICVLAGGPVVPVGPK